MVRAKTTLALIRGLFKMPGARYERPPLYSGVLETDQAKQLILGSAVFSLTLGAFLTYLGAPLWIVLGIAALAIGQFLFALNYDRYATWKMIRDKKRRLGGRCLWEVEHITQLANETDPVGAYHDRVRSRIYDLRCDLLVLGRSDYRLDEYDQVKTEGDLETIRWALIDAVDWLEPIGRIRLWWRSIG